MKQITYDTEMTFAAPASRLACALGNPGALRGRHVR